MEYYWINLPSADGVAAETTLRDHAPAPIGSRLQPLTQSSHYDVYSLTEGRCGLGFLTAFKAGARHRISLLLRPLEAETIRLEVHGSVTRMQKAVAVLGADGKIMSQAEEVARLDVTTRVDGNLAVCFDFVPFRSLIEWFYIFGSAPAGRAADARLFAVGEFRVHTFAVPRVSRSTAHVPVVRREPILFACQSMTIYRNYAHIHLEIYKPETQLVGIDLTTVHPFSQVQWWTGALPISAVVKPLRDGWTRLQAQKSRLPIRSPALMDEFGVTFANEGHVLCLLFAELLDYSRMAVSDVDEMGAIVLEAHFSDGASHMIDLSRDLEPTEPDDPWIKLVKRHLDELTVGRGSSCVFLEAGARGGESAKMRARVAETGWHYIGVDIEPDANVDIVSDVHAMGPAIGDGSVDIVYTSEVMEHLLSPQDFVRESNRVLVNGGLFIARAPMTWPLHAEPWDFWRFSPHAWQGLLNPGSGFEILEICEFGESSIVPALPFGSAGTLMATYPAPMLTGVVARKTTSCGNESQGTLKAWGRYDAV